ncbi:MAG: cache domain-containing protein, partial [Clostridiales bacterium]|nr:cache domain-containing protein [Clostridiales bacterium]
MKKRNGMGMRLVVSLLVIVCVLVTGVVIGGVSINSLQKSAASSIDGYETAMNSGYELEIQSEVETAVSILEYYYEQYEAGEMTEDEAQYAAKEAVRVMRYREDSSGYFWIDDTDSILIMHPVLTEQEGDNRYDLEDQNGVKIIQNIISTVNDGGSGFNEFYFTKSDGVTVAPKLAYSELFEPWGWIVSTGNYIDDMQAEMEEQEAIISGNFTFQIRLVAILSVVILVIFIIVGWVTGSWLCSPIVKLAGTAEKIADGHIEVDVPNAGGTREIAALTDSFTRMLDNFKDQARVIHELAEGNLCVDVSVRSEDDAVGNGLSRLVTDTNAIFMDMMSAAEEIHTESSQVAIASQSLAQGSTEQASAIQEITASVADIADKSKINAEKIERVTKLILEAGDNLTLGNEKMREMVTAMDEINEASQNIQKVLKAIDDIAFNTNILALNASVEASRAGEMGKGFAVVADEVKNLAGRSADEASRTADMIGDSIAKAKRGSALAQETKDALDLISSSMETIVQLSKDVAVASEEQVSAVSQINEALAQTSTVTQTNSSASEECAAASEQMS